MQSDIDGFLVGGASLNARDFEKIVHSSNLKIAEDDFEFLNLEVALLNEELAQQRHMEIQTAKLDEHNRGAAPASYIL